MSRHAWRSGSSTKKSDALGTLLRPPLDTLIDLYHARRFAEAESLAEEILSKFPNAIPALKILVSVQSLSGNIAKAIEAAKKLVEIEPADPANHHLYGCLLRCLGQTDLAIDSWKNAIRIKSDFFPAYQDLINALRLSGRHDEAEAILRQAILKHTDASLYYSLGSTLEDVGRWAEAAEYLHRALELQPVSAQIHAHLGKILNDLGQFSLAEDHLKQAITLKPDFAKAHCALGLTLKNMLRFDEATNCLRQAVALDPGDLYAYSNLLFALTYGVEHDAKEINRVARHYGSKVSQATPRRYTAWHLTGPDQKLHLGFVSGDFRRHPVGYFIETLLHHIDKSSFKISAYQTSLFEDDLTARIKNLFDHWQGLNHLNNMDAADLIHRDGPNILIDLSGHTAFSRLELFAYKPAPVQVSWLGYCGTTGIQEMDYLLGDPLVTPPDEEHHFTERIWRLPETYVCFSPPDVDIEVNPLPALRNGFVTFGCFNNLLKLNERVLSCWVDILRALPNARLFLKARQLGNQHVAEGVLRRFAHYGVTAERIKLEESTSNYKAYLAAYHQIDISLDTFPYPGLTTSAESLWMGVPVLTKRGDHFLSHNGECIARNTGQQAWIAADEADYVMKAVSFASNLPWLSQVRAGLRPQVTSSPFFDREGFARHFQTAMQGIWNGWRG